MDPLDSTLLNDCSSWRTYASICSKLCPFHSVWPDLVSLPIIQRSKYACVSSFLPMIFSLMWPGVAQNCEHKFAETAESPRFRFFGNVQVTGNDPTPPSTDALSATIPLDVLRSCYDATLLTYGASFDRLLNIPGESTLANVFSARSFVNWYNGHPYTASLFSPLLDLSQTEHVTIIGQGNVALDVARLLLKPLDQLSGTDIPEYALAELARSRIKRVEIVGRRGPLQLACTTKEIREMMALPGVGFSMDQELLKKAKEDLITAPDRAQARIRGRAIALMASGSETKVTEARKEWSFEFLKSPTALHPSPTTPLDSVGSIDYDINELYAPTSATPLDPINLSARRTGVFTTNRTDLVMKSVGYRSVGLAGLPFDEKKGVVRNDEGRVIGDDGRRVSLLDRRCTDSRSLPRP